MSLESNTWSQASESSDRKTAFNSNIESLTEELSLLIRKQAEARLIQLKDGVNCLLVSHHSTLPKEKVQEIREKLDKIVIS